MSVGLKVEFPEKEVFVPIFYQSDYRSIIRVTLNEDIALFEKYWNSFIPGFEALNILEKTVTLLELYTAFIEPTIKFQINKRIVEIKWDNIDHFRKISNQSRIINLQNVQIYQQIPTSFTGCDVIDNWLFIDNHNYQDTYKYLPPYELTESLKWVQDIDQQVFDVVKVNKKTGLFTLSTLGDILLKLFSDDIIKLLEFERFFISKFDYSITDLNNYTPIELKIHQKQLIAKIQKQHEQANNSRNPYIQAQKQSEN